MTSPGHHGRLVIGLWTMPLFPRRHMRQAVISPTSIQTFSGSFTGCRVGRGGTGDGSLIGLVIGSLSGTTIRRRTGSPMSMLSHSLRKPIKPQRQDSDKSEEPNSLTLVPRTDVGTGLAPGPRCIANARAARLVRPFRKGAPQNETGTMSSRYCP